MFINEEPMPNFSNWNVFEGDGEFTESPSVNRVTNRNSIEESNYPDRSIEWISFCNSPAEKFRFKGVIQMIGNYWSIWPIQ